MNAIIKVFTVLVEAILILSGLAQALILPVGIIYGIYYVIFNLMH